MKKFLIRLVRLIFGLFLYALGVVVTIQANVGYAPWEVLHVGISRTTGMSIGTASILIGLLICVLTFVLGEKLGIGTILNMVLIGVFIDLILFTKLIPTLHFFPLGVAVLIAGLFIIAVGSYFYIGSGFGAGPRDSMMVAVRRKTGLPIGLCRGIIEVSAVAAGWKLGGMVGLGTVIAAFAVGFCVQIIFKLVKFDAAKVQHETLSQTFRFLVSKGRG